MASKAKVDWKLDLHAPIDPDGQTTATIPISWCFQDDSPLRQYFEENDWVNPHVLLVVSHLDGPEDWTNTAARLVPITAYMDYVSFRRPGINRVNAVIVDVTSKGIRKELNELVKGVNTGYHKLNLENPNYAKYNFEWLPRHIIDENLHLDVTVPTDMFAKPRRAYEKKLTNMFFSTRPANKPRDECHARRRFLISLPLFLVTLPVFLGIKVAIGVLAAVSGCRPSLKVWNIFETPPDYVMRVSGRSIWFQRWDSKDKNYGVAYDDWRMAFWFLNPMVLFIPGSIFYAVINIRHRAHAHKPEVPLLNWGYWHTILTVDLFMLLILGAAAAAFGLFLLVQTLLGYEWVSPATKAEREKARRERERAELLAILEQMTCGTNPPPTSVGQLPKKQRTLSLRFNEFKTKVCKPFAT